MMGGGGLGALVTLYPMVGFSVPHSMGREASAPPSMARVHMEKK